MVRNVTLGCPCHASWQAGAVPFPRSGADAGRGTPGGGVLRNMNFRPRYFDPGAWMNRMLDTQADVPAKLAAHPNAVEPHAFLWATVASDFGVQLQFEPCCGNALPLPAPALREE